MPAADTPPPDPPATAPSPPEYVAHAALGAALPEAVAGGIASKPLFRAPGCKVTLFRFDAGQGMTEHTSRHAATLQVLEGRLRVQVGDATLTLEPGGFLGLEPRAPHALEAERPTLLLLSVMAP